ncbi:MAG: hypothetical protein LKJ90_05065 [Faecalibacterium sp.]|jgi:hypothetical protein|nr:hypothetical protein [Faecalibacterium sp.]
MTHLECSERDCCNNKAGCCCLDTISVQGEGEHNNEAVCCSYRADSGFDNAVGEQSAAPATDIRCNESCCCHNETGCCCADRVDISECGCGPECKMFAKED